MPLILVVSVLQESAAVPVYIHLRVLLAKVDSHKRETEEAEQMEASSAAAGAGIAGNRSSAMLQRPTDTPAQKCPARSE